MTVEDQEAAVVEIMLADEEADMAAAAKRAGKALRALANAPGMKAKPKGKGKGSGIQAAMLCV